MSDLTQAIIAVIKPNEYLCKNKIMSDNKNMDKPPYAMFIMVAILILIAIVLIIKEALTGLFLFLSDGGWVWLIVVIGFFTFVALVMHAAGK